MNTFWTQLRIEHRIFLRDRTVLAFHIMLPVLLLVLLTQVHGNMLGLRWTLGVDDQAGTPAARTLIERVRALPGVQVVEGTRDDLRRREAAGHLGVLVTLSAGTSDAPQVTVEGDSQAAPLLRAALAGLRGDDAPVATPPAGGLLHAERQFSAVILPGVVGMVVASVALFGFGARLASYRQRGFLVRLAVTPLGVPQFLLAQTVHRVAFIVVEGALLALIGRWLVGAVGDVDVGALLTMLLAGALAFCGLGFLIGGLASSGEAAAGWCHLLFFPMLLLSGAFYPTVALPGPMQLLAPLLPMTYLLDGLQRALAGVGGQALDALALGGLGLALLAVSAWTFSPE